MRIRRLIGSSLLQDRRRPVDSQIGPVHDAARPGPERGRQIGWLENVIAFWRGLVPRDEAPGPFTAAVGNMVVGAWWLDPGVGLLIAGVAVKGLSMLTNHCGVQR